MIRRLLNIRLLIAIVIIAAVLAGAWLWYRGSSLVGIRQVTVAGLSGPDVPQIRSVLTQRARTMTTLDVSAATLQRAVSRYPEVSSLSVTTRGSHAVTIHVVEKIPVAKLGAELIDGSGYVLASTADAREPLPQLKATGVGGAYATTDGQVTGADNRAALTVLADAPYVFLAHVQSARYTASLGVVLQLRSGPQLYFGPAQAVREKWRAVIDVLASGDASGACYINVTDPQRPAAGVNSERFCTHSSTAQSRGSSTGAGAQTTATATTPSAPAPTPGGGASTTSATTTTGPAGATTATSTTPAGTSTAGT